MFGTKGVTGCMLRVLAEVLIGSWAAGNAWGEDEALYIMGDVVMAGLRIGLAWKEGEGLLEKVRSGGGRCC